MIFKSNRQLWLTHDGEREKMQFPVLPEKFSVSLGTKNTRITSSTRTSRAPCMDG